jgi:L-iditol 2-dehydrogenase
MPIPAPDEALVRVTAVGLCGSDLHWLGEGAIGDARLDKPLVLGHEFAGVTAGGARVAVDPAIPCGECEFCREGNPNLCTALRFAGHSTQDGALREYVAWQTRCVHPVPDSLTDIDGALLEPLGVALHALDLGHVKSGTSIGVFGCGPIGLLIVRLARVAGATTIIATDKLTHRLDAARAFGATHTIQADGQEASEILAITHARGIDVAFEAAGANAAVEAAIAAAKPGARVVLVGIPDDDRTAFTASIARRKGLTIKLSRRMKHTYPRAIQLAASGKIDLRSLVTHRFPLAEFQRAFSIAQKREGLKVIIEP